MRLELESSTDFGNRVVCDFCNEDYTESHASGGILFGNKAACPECAPRIEKLAKKHQEQNHIKARCPEGMTFKEWCLSLRGGDNTVKIYSIVS